MTERGTLAGFVHRFDPGDAGAPVLLLLHGTGADENDLVPLGRTLSPDAGLLSPRGPVLENGMPRFFRRLAEGVFDLDDLARRTMELASFLREARAHYGLDDRLVVAVGFSNGANIAASMLLSGDPDFAAAILFRAMTPFEPERTPSLPGTPVLLSSGRRDPIAPPPSAERLARLLTDAGADVTLRWDEGTHAIGLPEITFAREWLVTATAAA